MRIVNLIENTEGHEGCAFEHGLSFYIETPNHKILMDAGATDASIKNAKLLGINLTSVDTLILSHGHYDHTGGVLTFAAINDHADIYLQKSGAGDYYNGDRYIGIDKAILDLPKLHLIEGDLRIDDEIYLMSRICGRRHWPQSNRSLSKLIEGEKVQDDFTHEQCLVLTAEGKTVVISGCAHNGILNVLDRYHEQWDADPDCVLSGFHMMKKTEYTQEEMETIQTIARELTQTNTLYYSGHCTGEAAFVLMKEIMGEKLLAIHSGNELPF